MKGHTMPKHTSLPGYPLAQRIMSETARDFDALYDDALDGCDIDDPETGTRRKRPSPDLCLDALMILRLMSSHATAGSPSMLPQPGAVTLIFVPGFDDVKRLRPLMEKLNVELMSSGKTRPQHLVNLDIIAQPSAGATVHDMRRFNESIREVALRGNPAVVIAGSERAVDPDIERIASATLWLEPATSQMLDAVLKLLFPGSRQSTPKVDLSGMGELQLARIFAADGAAEARKALRAIKPAVASTAGAPTITLDKVHGQPGAKAAFQQLLDDLNDWRKGSLD